MLAPGLLLSISLAYGQAPPGQTEADAAVRVVVPLNGAGEIDLAELVTRLVSASGLKIDRPPGSVRLPVVGLGGDLGRRLIQKTLGPGVGLAVEERQAVVTVDPSMLTPTGRVEWAGRVQALATLADEEARRRLKYGLHARPSYRANDPTRPTVCLVHGVNSSSRGFMHLSPELEKAGYGVVEYDYPYNRSLEESAAQLARDWSSFRRDRAEARPWSIVCHSMGALIARDYVEGPSYANDVSTLVMIAPVNQGSRLAQTQTLLQLVKGLRAVNGPRSADALASLGDGLGAAATAMTPGSPFLRALNARPRRPGVAYHILAGDAGVLSATARGGIEDRLGLSGRGGGLLGGLARVAAAGGDLPDRLDELTDGTGDGCVAVARTRLDGVDDHVVIHANHAELIRAPLLFSEPGPVACMPYLLRWLGPAPAPAPVWPATHP